MAEFEADVKAAVDDFKRDWLDRLNKLVGAVTDKLEKELAEHKIPARVVARVKSSSSLRDKLLKWADDPKKRERIGSDRDTLKCVKDLAGIRVTTYTESDRFKVANLVAEIFQSPQGMDNFNRIDKENVARIKNNPKNHYRATHMQICLQDDDATDEFANLHDTACELQVSSMLAHVWNEIEHDTHYKKKSGDLSEAEKRAIDSLGLLTKTGDNTIETLLYSQDLRKEKEQSDSTLRSEMISDELKLSEILKDRFGDKVAGEKIDFNTGAGDLLFTLKILGWNHPSNIRKHFFATRLKEAKKLARKLLKSQKKARAKKSFCQPETCDLFLVATFMIASDKLEKKFKDINSNTRAVTLLNVFRGVTNKE